GRRGDRRLEDRRAQVRFADGLRQLVGRRLRGGRGGGRGSAPPAPRRGGQARGSRAVGDGRGDLVEGQQVVEERAVLDGRLPAGERQRHRLSLVPRPIGRRRPE